MKNNIKDYQWPSSFIRFDKKYNFKKRNILNFKKLNRIENFFRDEFNHKNLHIFPSARACIALVLRYLKITREDEVFVNKWVSHCIFNTVGAYANITTKLDKPKLSIAVHKWGQIQLLNKNKTKYLIEDSVDSLISSNKALFVNNGDFEIFSLPKIIGSISGGIIISKNKKFISFCKKEQKKNIKLGSYQFEKKVEDINKKKTFDTWLYHESWNTFMDINALDDITRCIPNYKINKRLIYKRKKIFEEKFNFKIFENKRIGPVIPIPLKYVKNKKLMKKNFMIKHINKDNKDLNNFIEVFIIPIHFKIKNTLFLKSIKVMEKSLKKNAKTISIF